MKVSIKCKRCFKLNIKTYLSQHQHYYVRAAYQFLSKDDNTVKRVQPVRAKLVTGSYYRMRADLILVFCIFENFLGVNVSCLFDSFITDHPRGYGKKAKNLRSNKVQMGFRFSNLVVSYWNTLPKQVVSLPSAKIFKEKLGFFYKPSRKA